MNFFLSRGLKEAPTELIAVILFTFLTILVVRYRQKRHRLPPGPAGWPLIGSALKLPKEREWLVYQTWSTKYGMYCNAVS